MDWFSIIGSAVQLAETIPALIAKAKQSGELTVEQEAEFNARLDVVFKKDYAQPRGQ